MGNYIVIETGLEHSIGNIVNWHFERNLIAGSDDKQQVLKLIQEVGELSDSICKSACPIDGIFIKESDNFDPDSIGNK